MLLSDRFRGHDLSLFFEHIFHLGKEAGLVFGHVKILSNSRLALMASEYARDQGHYDAFHENIFHAYFTEGLDIGKVDVIAAVARKSGLDEKEIIRVVHDGRYAVRLNDAKKEGELLGLTGIPLFIINNKHQITGTQAIETFRKFIDKIQ